MKKTTHHKLITRTAGLLSSQTRVAILELLLETPEGLCVNQIADHVGLSQSATSHQLAKLSTYGVVEGSKEGQTICYKITDNDKTQKISEFLNIFA